MSVYVEVRSIYINNRKCVPSDGSYVKRTKLNTQERKKLRGIMPLLEEKGRFRNVSIFPRDWIFKIVVMVMSDRVRFL